jgi:hypothetical protein
MASNSLKTFINSALVATTTSAAQTLNQKDKSFIAWLNVSANNGSTTVSAKIQHSPDGTNWKDLATFANVVNTTSTEAINITTNVFGNVRAVATLTGVSATVIIQLWYDSDK